MFDIRTVGVVFCSVVVSLNLAAAADFRKPPRNENIAILLQSEALRRELSLTDEQWREILLIQARINRCVGDYVERLERSAGEDPMALQTQFSSDMKRLDDEAARILDPLQLEKLERIVALKVYCAENVDGGLLQPDMVARLSLSPEQRAAIQARIDEVEPKLRARVESLKEEIRREESKARDSILDLLTKEQRDRYEGLIGQRFGE